MRFKSLSVGTGKKKTATATTKAKTKKPKLNDAQRKWNALTKSCNDHLRERRSSSEQDDWKKKLKKHVRLPAHMLGPEDEFSRPLVAVVHAIEMGKSARKGAGQEDGSAAWVRSTA